MTVQHNLMIHDNGWLCPVSEHASACAQSVAVGVVNVSDESEERTTCCNDAAPKVPPLWVPHAGALWTVLAMLSTSLHQFAMFMYRIESPHSSYSLKLRVYVLYTFGCTLHDTLEGNAFYMCCFGGYTFERSVGYTFWAPSCVATS